MQQLSPKKYIETKARSLPIHKCIVNENWENSKMVHAVIMRRHVTGNITMGYYLVDLMCLGVKDTFYEFNVSESYADERFNKAGFNLIEVDYATAHNIIYAGHDFAMDYEITPHKDFALTKFILQEDNDNIPLINIATGYNDGKPHLMINELGEGKWALPLLKKNAGEGNYFYSDFSTGFKHEDDSDEDDFDEDAEDDGFNDNLEKDGFDNEKS